MEKGNDVAVLSNISTLTLFAENWIVYQTLFMWPLEYYPSVH